MITMSLLLAIIYAILEVQHIYSNVCNWAYNTFIIWIPTQRHHIHYNYPYYLQVFSYVHVFVFKNDLVFSNGQVRSGKTFLAFCNDPHTTPYPAPAAPLQWFMWKWPCVFVNKCLLFHFFIFTGVNYIQRTLKCNFTANKNRLHSRFIKSKAPISVRAFLTLK